jgi:D-alanine-D-alanine ligase
VVKPALEGSIIGVSIVRERVDWQDALNTAFRHDDRVLVETYVEGKEITVAILNGTPLPLIYIDPIEGFYDFTSKYTPGRTLYHVPAPLDATVSQHLQNIAVQAFNALGCAGCARVDIILSEKTGPIILEINTIPGMTPTSLVPKAAAAAGIDFPGLAEAILASASLKTGRKGEQL